MTYPEIKELFSEISVSQIRNNALGVCWTHVDRPIADTVVTGRLINLGEDNPNAKLTNSKVRRIRSLKREGKSYSYISNRYNISTTQTVKVVKRKNWGHIA